MELLCLKGNGYYKLYISKFSDNKKNKITQACGEVELRGLLMSL
jgi:hypothetical protein